VTCRRENEDDREFTLGFIRGLIVIGLGLDTFLFRKVLGGWF